MTTNEHRRKLHLERSKAARELTRGLFRRRRQPSETVSIAESQKMAPRVAGNFHADPSQLAEVTGQNGPNLRT
jgi:hypothetical protein